MTSQAIDMRRRSLEGLSSFVVITDDDGVVPRRSAVAASRQWHPVSTGVRRVNLDHITHQSAT